MNPRPIPPDNLVDFNHAYRSTVTTDTVPDCQASDNDLSTRRQTIEEWVGVKLADACYWGLIAIGAWTLLKWTAAAIVAADTYEDCGRLARQADAGYIAQSAVPPYCDAILRH
jgi:hypothetical protein